MAEVLLYHFNLSIHPSVRDLAVVALVNHVGLYHNVMLAWFEETGHDVELIVDPLR